MTSGDPIVGEMFLRPGPSGHRFESVASRLNDADPFFPVKLAADPQEVVLVGKALVRYVVAPPPADDDEDGDAMQTGPHLLVTAVLDDGEVVTGIALADLPPDKVRTLDYVNHPGLSFLPIAQLDREYLVHRTYIRHFKDTSR
jgi:hypothetical protein